MVRQIVLNNTIKTKTTIFRDPPQILSHMRISDNFEMMPEKHVPYQRSNGSASKRLCCSKCLRVNRPKIQYTFCGFEWNWYLPIQWWMLLLEQFECEIFQLHRIMQNFLSTFIKTFGDPIQIDLVLKCLLQHFCYANEITTTLKMMIYIPLNVWFVFWTFVSLTFIFADKLSWRFSSSHIA